MSVFAFMPNTHAHTHTQRSRTRQTLTPASSKNFASAASCKHTRTHAHTNITNTANLDSGVCEKNFASAASRLQFIPPLCPPISKLEMLLAIFAQEAKFFSQPGTLLGRIHPTLIWRGHGGDSDTPRPSKRIFFADTGTDFRARLCFQSHLICLWTPCLASLG